MIQDSVIGYLRKRNQKGWRQGFFKSCMSADRIVVETFAPMVRATKVPILFNLNGKNRAFWASTAASVERQKLLPGRLPELYRGKAFLREPVWEALKNTKNFLS